MFLLDNILLYNNYNTKEGFNAPANLMKRTRSRIRRLATL